MSYEKEKTLKEKGDIFTNFASFYPYDKEKALQSVEKIGNEEGRIKLYESFFLMFTNYIYGYQSFLIETFFTDNNFPGLL